MTAQQDWEAYARLITKVSAVGAGEQRRQAERQARRARDREDAEAAVRASVQSKQALEQRVQDLEAHAAAVLRSVEVSPTGKQLAPSPSPIRSADDADRAIDRLGQELDEAALRLREVRIRRTGQGHKVLAAVILIWVPVAAGLLIYGLADANSMEAFVGAVDTALAMGLGYRAARARTSEQDSAGFAVFTAVAFGLLVAGLAYVVVAGIGLPWSFLCLIVLTVMLIGGYRRPRDERVR
jgi:hypothetical protein